MDNSLDLEDNNANNNANQFFLMETIHDAIKNHNNDGFLNYLNRIFFNLRIRDNSYITFLHIAAKHQALQCIDYILDQIVDCAFILNNPIEILDYSNNNNYIGHAICEERNRKDKGNKVIDLLKLLVNRGYNINLLNKHNNNVLLLFLKNHPNIKKNDVATIISLMKDCASRFNDNPDFTKLNNDKLNIFKQVFIGSNANCSCGGCRGDINKYAITELFESDIIPSVGGDHFYIWAASQIELLPDGETKILAQKLLDSKVPLKESTDDNQCSLLETLFSLNSHDLIEKILNNRPLMKTLNINKICKCTIHHANNIQNVRHIRTPFITLLRNITLHNTNKIKYLKMLISDYKMKISNDPLIHFTHLFNNLNSTQIIGLAKFLFKYEITIPNSFDRYSHHLCKFIILALKNNLNQNELISAEPIEEIDREFFICLHNGVVWNIKNLSKYVKDVVKGVNRYDKFMGVLANQQIWDKSDLPFIRNYSSGRDLIQYLDIINIIHIFSPQDLIFIKECACIFWAKGDHFEKTIKELLTAEQLKSWNSYKDRRSNSEMPYGMPQELHDILLELKSKQLHAYRDWYLTLSDDKKKALTLINPNLQERTTMSVINGNSCIMEHGSSLTTFYERINQQIPYTEIENAIKNNTLLFTDSNTTNSNTTNESVVTLNSINDNNSDGENENYTIETSNNVSTINVNDDDIYNDVPDVYETTDTTTTTTNTTPNTKKEKKKLSVVILLDSDGTIIPDEFEYINPITNK